MKNALTSALLLAVVVSVSCNRGGPAATGGKPTVALVLKTLNHPFFVDMRRGAQEAADRLGVNLQVQAAEREIDVEKQMQIVENMIQTGIQALCITPSGSREIVSALVKARDAKVPIVVVDTRVDAKAAADAGVRQLLGDLAMARSAAELVDDVAVPIELQPFQAVEDGRYRLLGGTLAIGVLDPQQHLAAAAACIEPVEQCGAGAADMEEAGRRGGKARDDGIGHWQGKHCGNGGGV